MKVSMDMIKKLREMTGAGVMDCRKALEESEGDIEKAIEILRKKVPRLQPREREERQRKAGSLLTFTSTAE